MNRTVFSLPGKYGKGILVTPTVHGNLLLGPTAEDIENKEGTNTSAQELEQVIQKAGMNVKKSSSETGDHFLCRPSRP